MYGQEYLKFYNMTAFLTTWTTTSPNETVTIPTTGGGYLYDVAWGDGTTSVNRTGNATHVYSTPGDYQISITGSFPRIYFNNTGDKDKIKSIDQWGVQPWISMESAFFGCSNLQEIASDAPNFANVTDMSFMFRSCNLTGDLNNWDVSNITTMEQLFAYSSFNNDLSGWNTSNVLCMNRLFISSSFNQSIDNWDVSMVMDMGLMFASTNYNQNIGSWNVSNVIFMNDMFSGSSSFNQDIGNWDVSSVTDMSFMFSEANSFNQNLNSWDVSNVIEMNDMFSGTDQFNSYIGNWNVENVISMDRMFSSSSFNQDIGSWNTGSVMGMSQMFSSSDFNQDLSNWNIGSVTTMEDMFNSAGLSTENYDRTLIGWAQQSPSGRAFNGGNSQYCAGADARDELINTYGWNITDGGEAVPFSIDNIFTNSNGTNLWEEAGNWSLFSRPTAIHNVIIPSGMTCIVEDWYLPTNFEDGLCYTIEIEDGAVFEVMDGATFRTAVPCNY